MSADPSTAAVPGLELSCDKSRLDLDWVCDRILKSYWGGHLLEAQIRSAVWNSLNIGAYVDGKQVGYLRVVGDGSIFSSLTDLFVDENFRGKGIGTALLKMAVEHREVRGTLCILRTRPENILWYYKNADFHLMDRRHGLMQRVPR